MSFSKTIRYIQICMLILTLLIIPLGITLPLLISAIIVFILITCAVVDLVHSIYLRLKKAYKLDEKCLVIDFISIVSGVIV
jgi:hypothetical protein